MSNRNAHAWFGAYLAFIAAHTLFFAVILTRALQDYIVGDWLINYTGGFVRRGLPGTIALFTSHLTHVPPQWIAFTMQATGLIVLMLCLYRLTRGLNWTPFTTAAVLSPAAFAYTVIRWDSGIRKEILLFAGLALWLCILEIKPKMPPRTWDLILSVILTVLFFGAVIAHEGTFVGGPYFAAGLLLAFNDWRRTIRISIVPAILSTIIFVAQALHPGSTQAAQAICHSLGYELLPMHGPVENVCSGSIAWLQITSVHQAWGEYINFILHSHFVRDYVVLGTLAFASIVGAYAELWRTGRLRSEFKAVLSCIAFAILGMFTLMYIALDWGRWIHMQAMCLTLLLIVLNKRIGPVVAPVRTQVQRYAIAAAIVLYATCWTLPDVFPFRGYGYIDLIGYWVKHFGTGKYL